MVARLTAAAATAVVAAIVVFFCLCFWCWWLVVADTAAAGVMCCHWLAAYRVWASLCVWSSGGGVQRENVAKIGDFGLVRFFDPQLNAQYKLRGWWNHRISGAHTHMPSQQTEDHGFVSLVFHRMGPVSDISLCLSLARSLCCWMNDSARGASVARLDSGRRCV